MPNIKLGFTTLCSGPSNIAVGSYRPRDLRPVQLRRSYPLQRRPMHPPPYYPRVCGEAGAGSLQSPLGESGSARSRSVKLDAGGSLSLLTISVTDKPLSPSARIRRKSSSVYACRSFDCLNQVRGKGKFIASDNSDESTNPMSPAQL